MRIHHTPIVASPPKNTNIILPNKTNQQCGTSLRARSPVPDHKNSKAQVPHYSPRVNPVCPPSLLDPHAQEFSPFSVHTPCYDDLDDSVDDAVTQNCPDSAQGPKSSVLADRVEDIQVDQALWTKFLDSDDSAPAPNPCNCHGKPLGSCPDIMAYHVDRIKRGFRETGLTPNMDGLREPLKFPSFPVDVWKAALAGYFDAHEINSGIEFGWDVSFTEQPRPKNARWNLQGASLHEKDVQHYIDTELAFGSIVGPFDENKLPFDVYCSPLNTVRKKNSEIRRTVVDCSQLDLGVNSFIDAHLHRGTVWKLSLPTSQTIIRLIQETRDKYPGQKVLIFKLDFQRWYR